MQDEGCLRNIELGRVLHLLASVKCHRGSEVPITLRIFQQAKSDSPSQAQCGGLSDGIFIPRVEYWVSERNCLMLLLVYRKVRARQILVVGEGILAFVALQPRARTPQLDALHILHDTHSATAETLQPHHPHQTTWSVTPETGSMDSR